MTLPVTVVEEYTLKCTQNKDVHCKYVEVIIVNYPCDYHMFYSLYSFTFILLYYIICTYSILY